MELKEILMLSILGLILYEEHKKFVEFLFNDPICVDMIGIQYVL